MAVGTAARDADMPINSQRPRRLVRGRIIGNGPREFESAHEYRALAAHRVSRLSAEASCFDAVGARLVEPALGQRVHRTAGVPESSEYAVRPLDDDGQIDAGLAGRLSFANTGDPENEQ